MESLVSLQSFPDLVQALPILFTFAPFPRTESEVCIRTLCLARVCSYRSAVSWDCNRTVFLSNSLSQALERAPSTVGSS